MADTQDVFVPEHFSDDRRMSVRCSAWDLFRKGTRSDKELYGVFRITQPFRSFHKGDRDLCGSRMPYLHNRDDRARCELQQSEHRRVKTEKSTEKTCLLGKDRP